MYSQLIQEHPCVGRLTAAVLLKRQRVLGLVLIELVVDEEVCGLALLHGAAAAQAIQSMAFPTCNATVTSTTSSPLSPPGTPALDLYPPTWCYTPNGTLHNITNSFYPGPPNTNSNDPHRVTNLRSPDRERDGACELMFDSPNDKIISRKSRKVLAWGCRA